MPGLRIPTAYLGKEVFQNMRVENGTGQIFAQPEAVASLQPKPVRKIEAAGFRGAAPSALQSPKRPLMCCDLHQQPASSE